MAPLPKLDAAAVTAATPLMKSKTAVSYSYGDPVLMALRIAAARRPPLYRTAQTEFADMISHEVNCQEWQIVGEQVLRDDGSTIQDRLEQLIAFRTGDNGTCHWVEPEIVSSAKSETWTGPVEGALTRQGERWRELRAAFSPGKEGDAAATRLLNEEADIFSAKVGSPQPGVEPGSEKKFEGAAPKLPGPSTNPWAPNYRGTAEQQRAEQIAIISSKGGPALAASLSRSCGVDLAGRPLRSTKGY